MIARVLSDERTRRAARRLRILYGALSALWMAALTAWLLVSAFA